MKPVISVIIPIYNAEKYLRDCIDSMVCQISDKIEIILVDDGSTDGSSKICDEYAQSDPRIKVVHKPNGGLVSARKAGVNVATGEYVASQDADDWFARNMFEKVLAVIDQYSPDLIHFDSIQVIDGVETETHSNLREGIYNEEDIIKEIFPILIEDENSRMFKNSITSNVIKRELYKQSQLEVDDRIKIGEDLVCVKPIIFRSKSMYIFSDCFGYYRINTDSMTKGHKPFGLDYPILIGKSLQSRIDMNAYDFDEQVARNVVHNLFNACVSRFYGGKRKKEIIAEINECLNDPYYKEMMNKCKYGKRNYRGKLLLLALKHKCYFLMELYCKSSLKSW